MSIYKSCLPNLLSHLPYKQPLRSNVLINNVCEMLLVWGWEVDLEDGKRKPICWEYLGRLKGGRGSHKVYLLRPHHSSRWLQWLQWWLGEGGGGEQVTPDKAMQMSKGAAPAWKGSSMFGRMPFVCTVAMESNLVGTPCIDVDWRESVSTTGQKSSKGGEWQTKRESMAGTRRYETSWTL